MKKKFFSILFLLIFIFLIFNGIRYKRDYETQGISSIICFACMGFR